MSDDGVVTHGSGLGDVKDMISSLVSGFLRRADPILSPREQSSASPCTNEMDGNTKPEGASPYLAMFVDWFDRLSKELSDSLPMIDQESGYVASCQAVIDADHVRMAAVAKRDEIAQHDPVDPDALHQANEEVVVAEKILKATIQEAGIYAQQVLQRPDVQAFLSDRYDDSQLITYLILAEATPAKLAQWCEDDPEQARQLLTFLQDDDWMRLFVQAGGARNGEYPRAVQLYYQINPDPTNSVSHRLALAVALELSSPYARFDTPNMSVDPLQRYIHYEQAYLLGELDPNFARFTVWEMRHVINSDATEEELGWGRQSLMNYRPDLVYSEDPQWQYCRIVRTDISYNDPDWYKGHRSYDQILSGGGKCGPRAWYGRFICKTFGIPTWGVTQPGHAAMARWTVHGWCMCLGADFQYSDWEGEGGLNFQLSTQAMNAVGSEDVYMQKVRRLEWVALFHKEDPTSIRSSFLPNPRSPWWSLSFFQRKTLAAIPCGFKESLPPRTDAAPDIQSRLERMEQKSSQVKLQNGMIRIPAVSCSKPDVATHSVLFMRSFAGGQQLFLTADGAVEYTLTYPLVRGEATKYILSFLVCTVHRMEQPITLIVCADDSASEPVMIDLPYTSGMWAETKPVAITLGGPDVASNTFKMSRANEPFGFALKELVLTRV